MEQRNGVYYHEITQSGVGWWNDYGRERTVFQSGPDAVHLRTVSGTDANGVRMTYQMQAVDYCQGVAFPPEKRVQGAI